MIGVERRKVDDVIETLFRNIIEKKVGSLTVRINKGDTFAVLDILYRHVLKQGRLTHAGLADHVHVAGAVFCLDAEGHALVARIGLAEIGYFVLIKNVHTILLSILGSEQ